LKISIKRDKSFKNFKVEKVTNLLEALYQILTTQDSTLTFDAGCRSGVCGCCSVRVNGKEKLACMVEVNNGDVIEPLRYYKVKKDLLVDKSKSLALLKREKATITSYKEEILNRDNEALTQIQTDCILCSSCYSACPVVEINPEFLGPFALTRAYRYSVDKREKEPKNIIDNIQNSGIWDCTLCNECTLACPMGIDPKTDIVNLRNQSAKFGYTDPNFNNMSFGSGFGFDSGF